MPVQLSFTFTNAISVIYIVTPIIIASFFLILSSINEDVKGLIYMIGASIAIGLYVLICKGLDFIPIDDENILCSVFKFPLDSGITTNTASTVFIVFTFIYVLIPMIINKRTNVMFIMIMSVLLLINIVCGHIYKCAGINHIFASLIAGGIFGSTWWYMISNLENGRYLYYDEMKSNSVQCSKPAQQTFKCQVFRNGVPLSDL